MTRTLEAAMARLATLPVEEQERFGRWLLDEIADEEQWTAQFDASGNALTKLAAEARSARGAGRTTRVPPKNP